MCKKKITCNTKTSEEADEERNENKNVKTSIEKKESGESEINMNETGDTRRESSSDSCNCDSTNDNNRTHLDEASKDDVASMQDSLQEKQHQSREAITKEKPEAQKQEMLFENLKIKNIFYKPINFEMSFFACDITGSLFLADGSLILCDNANSNVILLDKSFRMLHKIHFEGNPWDVALVSTNEIIVTLKSQKSLSYVNVESGRLTEGMSISLKRVPWGIATYKDNIITTFHNNPGKGVIEIRNRHGKVLRNITVDKHGQELFASPCYVAVNQHNGDIYVTDSRKQSITCLTFEGKPLYRMESEELKWPRKVILDDQGNCLLCASLANKILLIKNKSKSPLQSKEEKSEFRVWLKKCKRPQTVSIRWEDQTMIVGLNAKNMMLVLE
ncbi:RING finger protein nhl-1-like [Mercenaria mercenaria]|uniref:RING finger protein nhl-1-like n=1 Tax=Mercenaria mercenaria TaxID=6596 RepID=UPI00234F8FC8|nr:RING finger protein nhl-1-like [Mercenaria mercenaria]